ncbi:MAG: hypothetical protein IJ385_05115 [Ruminiclostridium sp.]|nr:hypothetical protein [Ruminiclostridium sp.]
MKKRLALILAICAVSSCAATPAEDVVATTVSVSSAETTTAVTDEEFHCEFADEVNLAIENEVSKSDILSQIDLTPLIDITTLEGYELAVDFVENFATEEEKQKVLNDNYMSKFAELHYIGTELADWLCSVNYTFYVGGEMRPSFTRLFYIKDGRVVKEIDDYILTINHIHKTAEKLYISTYDNGIFELDKATGKLKSIVPLNTYAEVLTVDEKYIFFHYNEAINIYFRENGETAATDIYSGMYDGISVAYNGEGLYYSIDDKRYCYDITSGETTETDIRPTDKYPWVYIGDGTDEYHIYTKYNKRSRLVSITVTENESGISKSYDLDKLTDKYGINEAGCRICGIIGDRLVINFYDGYLYAVDLKNDEVARIVVPTRYEHYSFSVCCGALTGVAVNENGAEYYCSSDVVF